MIYKLKELQALYGWSQNRMAQELGVDESYLSLLYRGKRRLTLETKQKIVRRFPELADPVLRQIEAERKAILTAKKGGKNG